MSVFDLLKRNDINKKVNELVNIPTAVLIDVRTPQEYKEGHIPKSINIPLQKIETIDKTIKDKDTPLYVYCKSGNRSNQACSILKQNGYTNVENIGGIMNYKGEIKK